MKWCKGSKRCARGNLLEQEWTFTHLIYSVYSLYCRQKEKCVCVFWDVFFFTCKLFQTHNVEILSDLLAVCDFETCRIGMNYRSSQDSFWGGLPRADLQLGIWNRRPRGSSSHSTLHRVRTGQTSSTAKTYSIEKERKKERTKERKKESEIEIKVLKRRTSKGF